MNTNDFAKAFDALINIAAKIAARTKNTGLAKPMMSVIQKPTVAVFFNFNALLAEASIASKPSESISVATLFTMFCVS